MSNKRDSQAWATGRREEVTRIASPPNPTDFAAVAEVTMNLDSCAECYVDEATRLARQAVLEIDNHIKARYVVLPLLKFALRASEELKARIAAVPTADELRQTMGEMESKCNNCPAPLSHDDGGAGGQGRRSRCKKTANGACLCW